MNFDVFKPLRDMGEYLDSVVEDDKIQLVDDGLNQLKWLLVIMFCEGVTIGVMIVFCAIQVRHLL